MIGSQDRSQRTLFIPGSLAGLGDVVSFISLLRCCRAAPSGRDTRVLSSRF